MCLQIRLRHPLVIFLLIGFLALPACSAPTPTPQATLSAATAVTKPDWFSIKMTDVRTGQTFSMNDFAGKVVLLETMAEWCPNCVQEQNEVKKLEGMLSHPEDLISISLDTDLHEDASTLKEYANTYGFDWYIAISPIEVDRALSNLYGGEFMNPPLAPMLIIDRQGGVSTLPFGHLKGAEALQVTLAPYLAP